MTGNAFRDFFEIHVGNFGSRSLCLFVVLLLLSQRPQQTSLHRYLFPLSKALQYRVTELNLCSNSSYKL